MEKEKKYLLLHWILLAGFGCLNLLVFYSSCYVWPTQGSLIWSLLLLFCPPFLYHLIFISHVLFYKRPLVWKKSYYALTILGGIFIAGGILQIAQQISLTRFETAYQPMIAQIQRNMPMPCRTHYFELPTLADYNQSVSQKILVQNKPRGRLFYDEKRFVLYFQAGSIDRDNSSLVYDSAFKRWHFFHNDTLAESDYFIARRIGLTACSSL